MNMDYGELAREFISNMRSAQVACLEKFIQDGIRGEMFVLWFIKESRGKIVPSNISSAAGVSSARVAMTLNSLEEKGLITRRIDNDDRRKVIVELTPKGEDYFERQINKQIDKMRDMLTLLGEEDAKELVRIVGRFVEVLCETK